MIFPPSEKTKILLTTSRQTNNDLDEFQTFWVVGAKTIFIEKKLSRYETIMFKPFYNLLLLVSIGNLIQCFSKILNNLETHSNVLFEFSIFNFFFFNLASVFGLPLDCPAFAISPETNKHIDTRWNAQRNCIYNWNLKISDELG